MPNDTAGITDELEITLNDAEVLSLATDAKGPVDIYVQTFEDGDQRAVDRWGNEVDEVPPDVIVQHESYPGEHGGPVEPEVEGEPE